MFTIRSWRWTHLHPAEGVALSPLWQGSVRTVERHISTIYGKIGVSGKVARAVATAYAHTHGLV